MITRLERLFNGTKALPADQRRIFDSMYMKSKSNEEICKELGVSKVELDTMHNEMLRSLRAVTIPAAS